MRGVRLILIVSLPFLCGDLFAQYPEESWLATYSHSSGEDVVEALKVDTAGNVYVTGWSLGSSSGTYYDFATIKYTSSGDTVWVRRYNAENSGDYARYLVVDDGGNVYVTGRSYGTSTDYDYATVKYTANGGTAWVSRYNGPGNFEDRPYGLDVDKNGYAYVTGYSYGLGSSLDYATVKYAPNGDTVWVRRYNGPANAGDYAQDLAVDTAGNVYVTGGSDGSGTNDDCTTIKYAPNGDTMWVKRYNGPGNSGDVGVGLDLDDSGNLYVTGLSGGLFLAIKYTSAGDTFWVRRYSIPVVQSASALDKDGNVYVTGWGNTDYVTVKCAPNGDSLWVRRYEGPVLQDYAQALFVDDSGNAYVTGASQGEDAGYDCATIKYATNGDVRWVRRYNGPVNGDDMGYALAVEGNGSVYVAGKSTVTDTGPNAGYPEYTTIKYVQIPCTAKPGDANASNDYSLGDAISIVNYIFNKPGCSPLPGCWLSNLLCRGDWDGSTTVTLSDVIRAVNFIFSKPGGPWNAVPSGVCCL